jgi:hypothetical protein
MHYQNLILTDKDGVSVSVEFAFADDGKVLMGKDGNTVTCIERSKVSDYTEIEEIDDPDLSDSEALAILMGGDGE